MRVLFTAWAWPSHLYPLVPLAWACRAAGHDVLVAGQPELLPTAAAAGFTTVRAGRDVDAAAFVRDYVLSPAGESTAAARSSRGPRALDMLAALTEAMADELTGVARGWGADVLVHELTTLAGPLAAAAAGIASVRFRYGVDVLQRGRSWLPGVVEPVARRLGVDPAEVLRGPALDPCPEALRVPAEGETWPIRYVPYHGARSTDGLRLPPPRQRRICITWGTTMAKLDRTFFPVNRVIAALAGLDAEIVVAVTHAQRHLLTDLPAGVTLLRSAALDLVLPSCDLLIHQGGAGTMLTGLRFGVPQVTVPRLPDHALHSDRLAAAGAGLRLTPAELSGGALRQAAGQVLATPAYRAAARALQAAMLRHPAPAETVPELARLATAGRGEPGRVLTGPAAAGSSPASC
ncbi:nucleotide disphospho-sugar-binding domain-containing protein [Actinoplanes sp. N902-109]|uniref:nucleotide disphospho-sugar-binding domain-containing protein n=1 Tax=Actinoplanes sp. (strain N902-109) TaxID=649831 RepID=UPI00032954E2|nr:nucleotide disphospho-sugar-binding domain-containing protein [Actinoplanes sp. N902-109]AGL16632.1 glycosyl transferase [Actinoplanes sp. N902-109]